MKQVAFTLKSATAASLVLFDEFGRSTAYADGVSLGWAVLESIMLRQRSKMVFATHFREMRKLHLAYPLLVKNLYFQVGGFSQIVVSLK